MFLFLLNVSKLLKLALLDYTGNDSKNYSTLPSNWKSWCTPPIQWIHTHTHKCKQGTPREILRSIKRYIRTRFCHCWDQSSVSAISHWNGFKPPPPPNDNSFSGITMTSHVDLTYITRHTPFWGKVTSTLDWCEYNYQFSPYIAELANTVSNIFIITLSAYGYWRSKQESLPSLLRNDYLFILLVGLGSAAFHGSLLYEAQLADELPMVLSATHASYVLFQATPGKKDPQRTKNLATIGIIIDILFALSYSLVYRDPTYHQTFFAAVLLLNAYRVMTLRRQKIAPLSEDIQAKIVKLFWSGGFSFVFAFIIWNIDNIFCGYIREWKNAIGWPAAFLLEGHSWWHMFTGLGSYLMAVGQHYLVLSIEEGEDKFKIGYYFGLPHIVRPKAKQP